MRELALWTGWSVILAGAGAAVLALLVFVPYVILDRLWLRLRAMDDFIRIAVRYFDEKNARDRSIMGTPE